MTDAHLGRNDISGSWILRSREMQNAETGERSALPPARGVLMLDPGGRMSVMIAMGPPTPATTEAQQAEAHRQTLVYSGRYRLEGERLITSVDFSAWRSWEGTEQSRSIRLDGDGLEILTDPARFPGSGEVLARTILTFDREGEA